MTKKTANPLASLIEKVACAEKGAPELDAEIWCVVNGKRFISGHDEQYCGLQAVFKEPGKRKDETSRRGQVLPCTRSVDGARDFVNRHLPNFYVTSGLCELSGHASIGPDYNGSQGARLKLEWPEDQFHEGFHADLSPGDGRHRECLAIVHCALQALMAKAGAEAA